MEEFVKVLNSGGALGIVGHVVGASIQQHLAAELARPLGPLEGDAVTHSPDAARV